MLGVLDNVDTNVQLKPDWALRKELEGVVPREQQRIMEQWSENERKLWNRIDVTDPTELEQVQSLRTRLETGLNQKVKQEYGHVSGKVLDKISKELIAVAVE